MVENTIRSDYYICALHAQTWICKLSELDSSHLAELFMEVEAIESAFAEEFTGDIEDDSSDFLS